MSTVTVDRDALIFEGGFRVVFQRTLRIPDDGRTYPLPPGLGPFPICRVDDYRDRVPAAWVDRGGVFIPMYQREALWLSFSSGSLPHALKVAVGQINAVSGKSWNQQLDARANDYLVCPPQPWLDGINSGSGYIRQFVAMPLGMGYTVEGQVSGEEKYGGIQIIVYPPKPGRIPEVEGYRYMTKGLNFLAHSKSAVRSAEMGLAAGGKMKQKIYPDPHGVDVWDQDKCSRVYVHIVNSMTYREITGNEPPSTPISARTYSQHGLPWFDLYDDHLGDIAPSPVLQQVKPIKEKDKEHGFGSQQDDEPIPAPLPLTLNTPHDKKVRDGDW
jgi:hypothetical protein